MMASRAKTITGKENTSNGIEITSRVRINIGGLHVSKKSVVIDTVLGSCIATCMYDSVAKIGGMNHFMLPEATDPHDPTSTRYGVNAMETLITDLMKSGAKRARLETKIFGGGHVLKIRESLDGVPQRNIDFVREFLSAENLPIVSEDVGGYDPRRILFQTISGRVLVKRLGDIDAKRTAQEEFVYLISLKKKNLDGDITLF